jgi:hypothetical protein
VLPALGPEDRLLASFRRRVLLSVQGHIHPVAVAALQQVHANAAIAQRHDSQRPILSKRPTRSQHLHHLVDAQKPQRAGRECRVELLAVLGAVRGVSGAGAALALGFRSRPWSGHLPRRKSDENQKVFHFVYNTSKYNM